MLWSILPFALYSFIYNWQKLTTKAEFSVTHYKRVRAWNFKACTACLGHLEHDIQDCWRFLFGCLSRIYSPRDSGSQHVRHVGHAGHVEMCSACRAKIQTPSSPTTLGISTCPASPTTTISKDDLNMSNQDLDMSENVPAALFRFLSRDPCRSRPDQIFRSHFLLFQRFQTFLGTFNPFFAQPPLERSSWFKNGKYFFWFAAPHNSFEQTSVGLIQRNLLPLEG